MAMKVLATLIFAVVCSTFVSAKGDHHEIARHLEKRFSGHATYFLDGLGACGLTNGPGDFIVALNTPQYGYGSPGPQCFKKIMISDGTTSTVATITDECPGCPYGSLDMSEGLFKFFNPLGVGEFPITWYYLNGGGGHSTTQPPPPPPRTTHTHHMTPTTTSTSTSAPDKTSTTSQSTSRKHGTKTHTTATTTTSPSSSPSTTGSVPPAYGNFAQISEVILSLENLLNDAE